jgi:hypothetical protein
MANLSERPGQPRITPEFLNQREQLSQRLISLNGENYDGRRAVILSGGRFLSGIPYLWTAFPERAYELGYFQAEELIRDFPLALGRAEIRERE